MRALSLGALVLTLGCGGSSADGGDEAEGSGQTEDGSGGATSSADDDGTAGDGDGESSSETGEETCKKNVLVLGYWPPTNEMLRQWSTNEDQNPGEWTGEDWEGHGFDVYSFFPEFPPDGDPSNDEIGDPGAVGSPESDLQVDYQDTSADFWRLMDTYQPHVLITTSRGGNIGWEIEAIEGGHGNGNAGDPSQDWASDRYGDEFFPTEATIEPRSWEVISQVRQGQTLPSQLPMDEIYEATNALGLASVQIDQNGTSGNFLSGFLGLHGIAYNAYASHNVAAGHIHVGIGTPVENAEQLIETTLEVVLAAHPAEGLDCPDPD